MSGAVSTVADSTDHKLGHEKTEFSRPLAGFHPTIWGEYFLAYDSDFLTINEYMKQEYDELKEEVRRMLTTTTVVDKPIEKLDLINAVQRLGVYYHFETEIEDALEKIYNHTNVYDDDKYNLYTSALRFRLLRQHGYNASCDTFNKFKDEEGNFKESLVCDIRGMLSLYEACHLSIHTDEILDEALVFTTTHLESIVNDHVSAPLLEKQIIHALNRPIRRGLPRLEARNYLSIYGEEDSHNETLLRFSKLDFNILQAEHKKELSHITQWWKGLDVATKLPYARDRIVELYFWIQGVYFEPCYALGRRLLTKLLSMVSIIDDTYDAYGSFEELESFTNAIERMEISCVDQLPEYMKPLYMEILNLYKEVEVEMAKEGIPYAAHYAKEVMKKQVQSYFEEAKWFNAGYVPTLEEYMLVALVSCGYQFIATHAYLGMKNLATKEVYDWVTNMPKILRASSIINRLMDDVAGHEVEQKRGHVASSIECCMKHQGQTREEVVDLFRKQVKSAWKDANEEFLKPTVFPAPLLECILNLARAMDVMFKVDDGYTNSHLIKDLVASLLKDPIPI